MHISHPGFNRQLEDQIKQNWTQEDSAKHWMKTDIKYMPKRADGTAPLKVTKQIHLPPGYYHNLKEAWIAIAYEMEKQHMEVMTDISKMDVDDLSKRQQLAQLNLAQPYVKITNTGVAPELDSLYVLIPANMEFEMEWKLAGLMGLVKDGTPTQLIVQEKIIWSNISWITTIDTNGHQPSVLQTNIHLLVTSPSSSHTPISIITSSWVLISVGNHFPPLQPSNRNKDNNNS